MRGRQQSSKEHGSLAGALALAEAIRLCDAAASTANWKRWSPYLSERRWSLNSDCFLSHYL
jgi:hypothetical protein